MSIEIDTFKASYKKPLDGGLFLATMNDEFSKSIAKVRETFKIYEGVASRIVRERNLIKPDSAGWGFYRWSGLMISIHLAKDEGFDALHEYYEYLSHQTTHSFSDTAKSRRNAEPSPSDYAEIMRRAWTFQVGDSLCTLCAFASDQSDICKKVEVGMEPKYELICAGWPLPQAA